MRDADWAKVAGPRSTFITADQARELLNAPSGSRPRIYGLSESGENANQILPFQSLAHLDDPQRPADRYWVSGTTIADLIGRA